MKTNLIRTEAPSLKVISLSEAKDHLKISGSDEDAYLNALIKSATTHAENFTERSFLPQTWEATLDSIQYHKGSNEWWDGKREVSIGSVKGRESEITLRRGRIESIKSFKYFTLGDVELVFDSENYFLDKGNFTGRIILKNGRTWPTGLRNRLAVKITYEAFIADTKSELNADIIEAVKLILAHLYENRGDSVSLSTNKLSTKGVGIPETAMFMLSPYRALSL